MGAKLFFYYSAMNAGKSTTLLQADFNYREQGMKTMLFTPSLDDRAGRSGVIQSRIGIQANATVFDKEDDLFLEIRRGHMEGKVSCVLIDEAQFLSQKQVLQLTAVCDRLDIPVLCYGIRTDFLGEPFEGSKYLLSWAEELIEIKTVCKSGKKATMNARLDADNNRVLSGEQVSIGLNYEAMSRKAFDLPSVSPAGWTVPDDLN
mmetsp:Transcript_19081/g.21963  ORF Transcript_19081/g.21963 Transcript_19081/m.21963 type:complete len:204 (+) Transcript_19081:65-676(+)|eukprot:CAMPEP_0194361822 /NCGR_PEP_ID=MMETSP0174-20130528/9441_1 /TAXON_ID=216777 /ORGANISM="Proboscia alata, Strain PI-D3" /LENGTH=203 /DNA_ID=CAMNT_0039134253 /DNA_START=61 /DNA_END=672 /DNA_ORIENTATION=-